MPDTISEWLKKLEEEQKNFQEFYTMENGEALDIEILDIEEREFTMKDGKQRKRYVITAHLNYGTTAKAKEKAGQEIALVFGRKALINLLTMLKLQNYKDFKGAKVRVIRVGEGLNTVYNFVPLS